jgi:tripartite-type tricarboxylate transporter receptor subunit TctC
MKLPHRRKFLHLTAGVAALPLASRIAGAQTYPVRPVRIIVPFAPGGVADTLARLIGQSLSERLGQPFLIENRPGAGTNIATEFVAKAPSDGYTLLMVSPANVINPSLYERLSFSFIRDIVPVASLIRGPGVMEVNPSFPAKTVPEFITYAKANPGKISFASAGVGTSQHLSGELFKMMAGVDMIHVPYRGGAPAITDLIGGQVQVMFDVIATSIENIRAGRLRAIADFLPGYEASIVNGIGAPRGTPTEVIDRLNKEINAILADSKTATKLAQLGSTPLAGSPTEYGRLLAEEAEKWAKVVKFSGAKAE